MLEGVEPGTILNARYTLERRLEAGADYERWVARDSSLNRDVVVLCMPWTSPRASAVLDAGRRAAGVDSAALVPVLEVIQADGFALVVEADLAPATSLADLVAAGPLPAEEVRRIVGEISSALERARVRGLHHLALTPEVIWRNPDGEVFVRGVATSAVLARLEDLAPDVASRHDAVAVVALTYAALTGQWPGEAASSLPQALTTGSGAPVSPSELVSGVPRDLDTLCRLTLAEDQGPLTPGDFARQIAPWSTRQVQLTRPVQLTRTPAVVAQDAAPQVEAAQAGPPVGKAQTGTAHASLDGPGGAAGATAGVAGAHAAGPGAGRGEAEVAETRVAHAQGAPARGSRPEPRVDKTQVLGAPSDETQGNTQVRGASADQTQVLGGQGGDTQVTGAPSEETQVLDEAARTSEKSAAWTPRHARDTAGRHTPDDAARHTQDPDPAARHTQDTAVPIDQTQPIPVVVAAKATDQARRLGRGVSERASDKARELRRVHELRTAPTAPGLAGDGANLRPGAGREDRAVPSALPLVDSQPLNRRESRWALSLIAGFLVLALGIGVWGLSRIGSGSPVDVGGPSGSTSPSSAPAQAPPTSPGPAQPAGQAMQILAADDFDPQGDNEENSDQAPRVYDGSPDTQWQSVGYRSADLGGLKDGVGVILDLGPNGTARAITLTLGNESSGQLYVARERSLEGAVQVGDFSATQEPQTIPVPDGTTGQYIIVWFTNLGQDGDRFRAILREITVTD